MKRYETVRNPDGSRAFAGYLMAETRSGFSLWAVGPEDDDDWAASDYRAAIVYELRGLTVAIHLADEIADALTAAREWADDEDNPAEHDSSYLADLPTEFDECVCCGCGCTRLATRTDDGGCDVCEGCETYTLDEHGQVVCSRDNTCDECGEARLSDALDAGGNSAVRLTGCACERAAALEAEDRDDDGDWTVLDMDGNILSRHATEEGADLRCSHDHDAFAAHLTDTHQHGSTAYQPRSVVDLTRDYRRDGQWSTTWSNVA
jgi:hypothetical protein